MPTYRVTAPYILLAVTDRAGAAQVNGFYDGAIVADPVDDDRLRKAIGRDWVELAEAPEVPTASRSNARLDPGTGPDTEVPEGTTDKVLTWVGDNPDRAAAALAAEQASTKPRTTLIDQLTKLAGQA